MAAGENTRDDLLQILIFTFFLCAIFFGGWGGWNYYKRSRESRPLRDRAQRHLREMEKMMRNVENREINARYQQEKKLKGNADQSLRNIALGVLDIMRSTDRPALQPGGRSDHKSSGKFTEFEYSFALQPCTLNKIVRYVATLEESRPDVKITKMKAKRKRPRGSAADAKPEDIWETDTFKIATYITE